MKQHHFPSTITDYVKRYYPGPVYYKVTTTSGAHGRIFYNVELVKDDMICDLIFNEKGNLLRKSEEEAFPEQDWMYE